MIVRWPGKIRPGTVTDHISAFWDFLPTACELAGIQPPMNTDGLSYLPTLLGKETRQKQHEFLYWEYAQIKAARMGNWKAVATPRNGRLELYDLAADPGESHDIAPENPDVVSRMKQLMASAHVDSPDFR